MVGGWLPLAGMSRKWASASKMSRPVGLAGWPTYSLSRVTSGAMARRTWRSTRQKTSRARQITVISAWMRRFDCKNIGATASGPLKLP
jgi:hypothetical protein